MQHWKVRKSPTKNTTNFTFFEMLNAYKLPKQVDLSTHKKYPRISKYSCNFDVKIEKFIIMDYYKKF